ncbi:hypothetical protein N7495_000670 [Penicillium taxi]|uniref:uncharacterized protein n=1 Tax=Penicillium taxi TaxID=168475 RepID=UPI0025451303|nr:uncharacterized protein N7495_000670 [Penicillium taxi]KAJ5907988.1 hypothetical protein N7495_000670 [Penicillium taxi]
MRPTPTGPMSDRPRLVSPSPNQPPISATFPQSPVNAPPRRELPSDLNRDTPVLQSRQPSPKRHVTSEIKVTSSRPSPASHTDRGNAAPSESAGRSPALRPSSAQSLSTSRGDHAQGSQSDENGKGHDDSRRPNDASEQQIPHRFNGNIPTQPRGLINARSPPLGPPQGPRAPPSHPRGAQNWPAMSAPTRPRRGPGSGSRDGPWNGPSINRRGPPTAPAPNAPSGPRASFTPSGPAGAPYRYSGPRQSTSFSGPSAPAPRAPNHLAGLTSIIPGGRLLPSGLDPATEKRLLQLEADQEKLLEQMNESQRVKRAGLRDWDRLDRESSICAQKSELLDGHLQRLADQSMGGGYPF